METKVYTLEQLTEANLIVRNEYSDLLSEMRGIISDLQSELCDAKERIRNLERTALYTGKEESQPTEAPRGFQDLTPEQDAHLASMVENHNAHMSDWEIGFVRSVREAQSTSEKQRAILNKLIRKVRAKVVG